MKHLLFLLSFCFSVNYASAQSSDWKQIENQLGAKPVIYYLTANKSIITRLQCTNEYYILRDWNSENWEQLIFPTDIRQELINFREDNSGKLYFFFDHKVYINDGNTFKQFTFQFQSEKILDIGFLSDNNLILLTNKRLETYDSLGKKLKTGALNISNGYLLPSKDGSKNYIVWGESSTTCSISEFSNELSFVGNPFSAPACSPIYKIKDRLIYENKYSDDGGKTWQEYRKTEDCWGITITGCNNIYLFSSQTNVIKLFGNQGKDSVKVIKLPFYGTTIMQVNNCTIAIGSGQCNNESIYASKDQGVTWTKINGVPKVAPNSSRLAAGWDESIVSVHCSNVIKQTNSSSWNVDTNAFYRDVFASSNKSFFVRTYLGGIYTSDNNVIQWEKNPLYIGTDFLDALEERNKTLLISVGYEIYKSSDFGKKFEKKLFFNTEFRHSKITFKNDTLAYFVPNVSSSQEAFLRKINLTNGQITECESKIPSFYTIQTSYDGNVLYGIKNFNQKMLEIYVSFDDGKTFETIFLSYPSSNPKLKTDHLGNVYIYDNTLILQSKDYGQTWQNITPTGIKYLTINDLNISHDGFIYIATTCGGVLKYKIPLTNATSTQDLSPSPLALYPNPTTGIVRIENINITSPTQVTVVDVLGKTVLKTTIQNNELDVSNLVAGVYSVQLKADGKLYIGKIVKE